MLKKLIGFAFLVAVAGCTAMLTAAVEEFPRLVASLSQHLENIPPQAQNIATHAAEDAVHHPAPYLIALGTLAMTVFYHRFKGRSLREAVLAAGARVAVLPSDQIPLPANPEESVTLRRARGRALYTQLTEDLGAVQRKISDLRPRIEKTKSEAISRATELHEAELNVNAAKMLSDEVDKRLAHLEEDFRKSVIDLETIRGEIETLEEQIPGL
jgi:hypothetical protein